MIRHAIAVSLIVAPLPAAARDARLEARITRLLAERAGPGTRFGLVVVDGAGREIVAINPDDRFMPASNTKIFTTVAAFASLPMDAPDTAGGARVRLEGKATPDVVLSGHGDARLSSAADCRVDCLAVLADAVAARTRRVGDVIGDDTAFPDQRWSAGMSWNNMAGRYGTATSALTLDDNEWTVTVRPGDAPGAAAVVEGDGYYRIDNRVVTAAQGDGELSFDRMPGTGVLRVEGRVAPGAAPRTLRVGVEDAAHRAAWRLAAMLRARGVKVRGAVMVRHRPATPADDPAKRGGATIERPAPPPALAALIPPPLGEDMTRINKESQNLHAELALRRAGAVAGTGSVADGLAVVGAVAARAGVPRLAWDLSDGSGMSTYNRVSPRGMVTLLRWVDAQPWGVAWRATLPVAGVDGTLAKRFKGTPLEGRLFAKTGSLNATNALAGSMTGRSGGTLTFAFYANDVPEAVAATKAMDEALVAIAEAS